MKEKPDKKKKVKVLTKERFDLQQLLKAPAADLAVAGQSLVRTDARQKVTGALKFGADYAQEGFCTVRSCEVPIRMP